MLETIETVLAYDHWANREALASLRRAGQPPERAVALIAHIAAALALWHERIMREGRTIEVWPGWSIRETESELELLFANWNDLVRKYDDAAGEMISYTNTKGEAFTSSIRQIVTHVMFHGSYHRGQIATLLKNAGHEPAYTDYIHAARQGFI